MRGGRGRRRLNIHLLLTKNERRREERDTQRVNDPVAVGSVSW